MAQFRKRVQVYPQREGEWALDNGRKIFICKDADAVGNNLEEALWPIISPALKAGREVKITIEYTTEV